MTKTQKPLQIEVSNFGPITKGKVCTKPLTIFTGPSNTGKTYLAKLFYSVLKAPEDIFFDDYNFIKHEELTRHLTTKGVGDILANSNNFFRILKPCVTLQQIQNFFDECFSLYSNTLGPQIYRALGNANNLVSYSKSKDDLEVVLNNTMHLRLANDQLISQNDNSLQSYIQSLSKSVWKDICIHRKFTQEVFSEMSKDFNENKKVFNQNLMVFLRSLNRNIGNFCFHHEELYLRFLNNIYYFPSARTGLIQTHRLIAAKAVKGLAGSYNKASKLTHSDIADFLDEIITIDVNKKQEDKEILRIVNEMETNILTGQVEVVLDDIGYPDFVFKQDNRSFKMIEVSSAVTDLAPIVLLLKYGLVKSGDTLIIDEPEIHLHPKAQKDMAKILVALVKAGVNIIITTHSETLLQEISNYRMAKEIPEEKTKEIMGNTLSLSENDLAVYSFKRNEKDDVTVEEVPFDSEDGISIKDHNDVSTELYDQTTDIYDESHKDEPKSST